MRFFLRTYAEYARQWTSLHVLSTPYVYVRKKNISLENRHYWSWCSSSCFSSEKYSNPQPSDRRWDALTIELLGLKKRLVAKSWFPLRRKTFLRTGTNRKVSIVLRLFSSDAFFYVHIRTECSEHVNSFIDAYWAYVYGNVRKKNASLENRLSNIYVRASIHLLTLIKTLLTISRHLLLFYLSFVEHSLAVQKRISLYGNSMEFPRSVCMERRFSSLPVPTKRDNFFYVNTPSRFSGRVAVWDCTMP